MLFNPPWETKIGQLQQVTRAIQRNSDALLDNRGAVIVRCYPYRSATYMHLVYNLIYSTLASNTQFGADQTPDEIRPILLNYSNSANQSHSNPSVIATTPHSATAFASGTFNFGGAQHPQQHQWTDCVLIRVHFRSHESALFFMQSFNRSVYRVFDRHQVRAPFCHADLTRPERVLRNYLQQMCDEKNNAVTRLPAQPQQYYRGRFCNVSPRYYHNGFHLYKEFPNGRVELVPWEQYSLGQYLHVLVASLRKYAALYKQKQCYVIIQNVAEHNGSTEQDTERMTSIVYSIVSTEEYRQRCIQTKQKLELLKNSAMPSNSTTSVDTQPILQPGGHLPLRIERLPRRGLGGASASRSTITVTTMKLTREAEEQQKESKGQQTVAAENQREADNAEGGQKENEGPDTTSSTLSTRPALIRVQFHTREAAIAFCQLFKEHQISLRQQRQQQQKVNDEAIEKHNAKDIGDGHDTGGEAEDEEEEQTDSYSDLSDLDVFSSCEEGAGGRETPMPTTTTEQKKSVSPLHRGNNNDRRQQRQQQLLNCLILGAFAHRDLTPPELALGYALRQHCREQNNNPNADVLLYPRAGQIFQRISAAEAKQ